MSRKFKIIIMAFLLVTIPTSVKGIHSLVETHRLETLADAIKTKQICNTEENIMECVHQQFLSVTTTTDPLRGQELLSEVARTEMEKNPEKTRYLKDQYYIFTANLYVRSLSQRQKSLISHVPFVNHHNVDLHVAKAFLKGMTEYSNRREVDRTIASETILQEVSNFNASMDELAKSINSFN